MLLHKHNKYIHLKVTWLVEIPLYLSGAVAYPLWKLNKWFTLNEYQFHIDFIQLHLLLKLKLKSVVLVACSDMWWHFTKTLHYVFYTIKSVLTGENQCLVQKQHHTKTFKACFIHEINIQYQIRSIRCILAGHLLAVNNLLLLLFTKWLKSIFVRGVWAVDMV